MSEKVIPPVKLYFPHEDIQRIIAEIDKVLQSGMLTLGNNTKYFEVEYAKLCMVRHAIAVNSGTSALEIALRTMRMEAGDEVLVPTNTFTATAATVFLTGGKPILTDIDPQTLCMDAENIQKHVTQKTKGVIVVHIGGLVCPDMKAVREICRDYKLFLIEDAAHAQGSMINGQPAGSLGDVGCFSFYPTKVMTSGEGGMITTNDNHIDEMARILRDQGKQNFNSNIIVELGNNWRLPEINAVIGRIQLERLPEIIERRNKIARYYDGKVKNINGVRPLETPSNIINNYYKYTIFVEPDIDRERIKGKLRQEGVRCGGEVYWPPLHLQPIYRRLLGTKEGDFPKAEDACSRMICLPMYSQMTLDDVDFVIEKLKKVLSEI